MSFIKDLLGIDQEIKQPHTKISSQEAHQLWNICYTNYIFLDNIKFNLNFIHDKDFKHIAQEHRDFFQNKVKKIEAIMRQYSIKSPKPSPKDIKIPERLEVIQDLDVAELLYLFIRTDLSVQMKTIKDAVFNDDLRKLFIKFIKKTVDIHHQYIEYLKMKNWIEIPPLYKTTNTTEQISANEIYHLWEHLEYRYIHIHQTKMYTGFIDDNDFIAILNQGLEILENQTEELEDLLLKYGVSLPTKYPQSMRRPNNKELFGDQYLFNMILNGMQNATFLHASSIQEMIVNKEVRKFFKELLYTEIDLINQLIKYGKLKGWLSNVPKLKRTQE